MYRMEFKEDVKTRNNAGDDINDIAREFFDYYDIAHYILCVEGKGTS